MSFRLAADRLKITVRGKKVRCEDYKGRTPDYKTVPQRTMLRVRSQVR